MGRYWKLNHTADLAIRVEAPTIEDLFITYARAMFETIIEGKIRQDRKVTFDLASDSLNELLLDWLRELIYLFETRGFIPCEFKIKIPDHQLSARIDGDEFDPQRHVAQLEIKTPTYHNFQLKNENNQWLGMIIFDV